MKNGIGVNYVCSHRKFSIITPSVEASSILRVPGWAAEVGTAGWMAAAVVGRRSDHTAVSSLATYLVHTFILGIGYRNTSLKKKAKKKVKLERRLI